MIETTYSDPDFLAHYGVKGMKWGVRKDQDRSISNDYHLGFKADGNEKFEEWIEDVIVRGNRSASGRKKFDASKHDPDDPDYGNDEENKLIIESLKYINLYETRGRQYADDFLKTSALKDYDYDLVLTEESYKLPEQEAEKWVAGSLTVYGNSTVFNTGIERDYSDEESYWHRKDFEKYVGGKTHADRVNKNLAKYNK